MRILVAGGTGAVGWPLVAQLIDAGHEVVATSRSDARVAKLHETGAEALRMDALNSYSVEWAVATAQPEVVIHQLTSLADGDVVQNGRLRQEGTRHLVDAAARAGVRRFIAQSIAWAYAPGDGAARETEPLDVDAPAPRGATVAGVVALEEAVREVKHHVVLRYGMLYGPHTWNAPGGVVDRQLRVGGLTGDPADAVVGLIRAEPGVSSFVHVHDAARAAVLALEWPNGVVNIVDDDPAPGTAWVPALARALGVPPPSVSSEEPLAWQRGADNTLARSLGWGPVYPSWRTGFARQMGAGS